MQKRDANGTPGRSGWDCALRFRSLKVEPLEPRQMLSVVAWEGNDVDLFIDEIHPTVIGVDVASPPVKQLDVTFLEDVDLSSRIADSTILSSITLVDLARGPVSLRVDQFAYDASIHQLKITWDTPLPDGIYELHIDGSQVADISGNLLLGGAEGRMLDFTTFGAAEILTVDSGQVQVDTYSVPSAVDWNADGRLDLIVGEKTFSSQGKVRVYLNQGTSVAPAFETFFYAQAGGDDLAVSGSGCLGVFPRMFDWDQDGLNDLVLGLANGTIQVALNENTDVDPRFGMPVDVLFGQPGSKTRIDVGIRATLDRVDWNNDGRHDLIVGAGDGKVRLFLNEADSGAPDFLAATIVRDGSVDLVVPSDRSSVAVADLNGDGRKDLVLGDTDGRLRLYPNLGTDSTPTFNGWQSIQADGIDIDLPSTPRSRPFVGDFNDDGISDLLVGSLDGLVRLYSGVTVSVNSPGAIGLTDDPGGTYVYTFDVPVLPETSLDVDANGKADALTDGILILRYLFGFRDESLTTGVIGLDATRTDPGEIADYLNAGQGGMLDVDANGTDDALTDGIMILRYLFGFTDAQLVAGMLSSNPLPQRTDPAEILVFLDGWNPTISPPAAAPLPLASPDSQDDGSGQESLYDILAIESIRLRPPTDEQDEIALTNPPAFDLLMDEE